MSPVRKMADNGRLTVDQMVKVVWFYAETKSLVATQRRFLAYLGTRLAPCKTIIYRLSLGIIFQSMRINSVPDVKCFCNNKICYVYNQWYGISCDTLYLLELYLDMYRRPCNLPSHNVVLAQHSSTRRAWSCISLKTAELLQSPTVNAHGQESKVVLQL